jgi:hypothetical protein
MTRWTHTPEQTVAAARHDPGVYLLKSIGQIIGLIPGVPDQAKPAARPQHSGRLSGGNGEI